MTAPATIYLLPHNEDDLTWNRIAREDGEDIPELKPDFNTNEGDVLWCSDSNPSRYAVEYVRRDIVNKKNENALRIVREMNYDLDKIEKQTRKEQYNALNGIIIAIICALVWILIFLGGMA